MCVCVCVCVDIGNYCLTVSAKTQPNLFFSFLLLPQLQQSYMFNKCKYSYLFITSLQRDEIHNEHRIPAFTVQSQWEQLVSFLSNMATTGN